MREIAGLLLPVQENPGGISRGIERDVVVSIFFWQLMIYSRINRFIKFPAQPTTTSTLSTIF
jgi:hypothetical protein